MSFGARLRRARLRAGLSQTDLGDALGVTKQQISRYETDEDSPSATDLPVIASEVKTPIGELFDTDFIPGDLPMPLRRLWIRRRSSDDGQG